MVTRFTDQLLQGIRCQVGSQPWTVSDEDINYCTGLLESRHNEDQMRLLDGVPPFDGTWAMKGLEIVHECARALVHREVTAEELSRLARTLDGINWNNAQVLWNLDIALRYLPGIYRKARMIAAEDPLCHTIEDFFDNHGLICPGSGYIPEEMPAIIDHNSFLKGILIERIAETRDEIWIKSLWFQQNCPGWLLEHLSRT